MTNKLEQAIFCVTEKGVALAQKINKEIKSDIYVLEKFAVKGTISFDKSLKELVAEKFDKYKNLVFVMGTGIVIRVIAGNIQTKDIDPAVISIDEAGYFVIPLLSGHLGGANNRAKLISEITKGIPVITTATDVSGKIAVDTISQQLNAELDSLESAKKVTSLILAGKQVSLKLPENVKLDNKNSEGFILITNKENIEISKIILQNICVGIGCKKGVEKEKILVFLYDVFKINNLSLKSIKNISSAWVKETETGLIETAEFLNKRLVFFSKEDILKHENLIEEKSNFVKETIGVYGVSEPCAYLLSNGKGNFLVKKAKKDGITISIFEEE